MLHEAQEYLQGRKYTGVNGSKLEEYARRVMESEDLTDCFYCEEEVIFTLHETYKLIRDQN